MKHSYVGRPFPGSGVVLSHVRRSKMTTKSRRESKRDKRENRELKAEVRRLKLSKNRSDLQVEDQMRVLRENNVALENKLAQQKIHYEIQCYGKNLLIKSLEENLCASGVDLGELDSLEHDPSVSQAANRRSATQQRCNIRRLRKNLDLIKHEHAKLQLYYGLQHSGNRLLVKSLQEKIVTLTREIEGLQLQRSGKSLLAKALDEKLADALSSTDALKKELGDLKTYLNIQSSGKNLLIKTLREKLDDA